MGASQEKKKRIEAKESGALKVNEREIEEQKKAKKFKVTAIVTAIVLVICVILILIFKSNFIYHKVDAVTVGDEKFSVADYNYFRQVKVNEFESYFGDISSVSDMINDDVIRDAAVESMESTTMYCKMAEEAGYTLSEDAQTKIDDAISTLKSYTNMTGASLDSYLQSTYGTGVTEEIFRKNAARISLADEYRDMLYKDLEYSDDFLEENYKPDEEDSIGFYLYTVYNSSMENEETAAEDAKAQAEEFAAKVTDAKSFEKLVAESSTGYNKMLYKYDPQACYIHNAAKSCNKAYAEWISDSARREGDIEVFSDDIGSYVVMYMSRNENRYHPVSIREIFFPHNVSYSNYESDLEYEDAYKTALETAHTSAEQAYDSWKEGEMTEDSFGKLAQTYNTAGTTADYGLVEIVIKDAYNEAIDDWCFNASRKNGDTEIIDTPNGTYVLYFVGEYPQTYRQYVVDSTLRRDDFSAWEEKALEDYPAVKKSGLRFAD